LHTGFGDETRVFVPEECFLLAAVDGQKTQNSGFNSRVGKVGRVSCLASLYPVKILATVNVWW